jgi:hypothetical protein
VTIITEDTDYGAQDRGSVDVLSETMKFDDAVSVPSSSEGYGAVADGQAEVETDVADHGCRW